MTIAVLADKKVGLGIVSYLVKNFKNDISIIFYFDTSKIRDVCEKYGVRCEVYVDEFQAKALLPESVEIGILAWWPKIVSSEFIKCFPKGLINTHNSYLPYNRGKHPYFWSIVEQNPYGVSLHYVDEGVDTGALIARSKIEYSWVDNSDTLYQKSLDAMIKLFIETYSIIKENKISSQKQSNKDSFHLAQEYYSKIEIGLEKKYLAKDLINLIRAASSESELLPSAYFKDNGKTYEIKVSIIEKSHIENN